MKKKSEHPLRTGLCATLSIACGLALAATPPSSPPATAAADEAVVLTGWLQVADLTMADVLVTVEVNGEAHTTRVTESGRFDLTLPADVEAVLRFEKPGHLAKEVTVDTRHAREGEAGRKTRHVKFAVILELERWMGGLTYSGPVGSIGFDPDGGCLAITRNKKMVPARQRHLIMKF